MVETPLNYERKKNSEGEYYFVHKFCTINGPVLIGKYSYLHGKIRISTDKEINIGKFCSIADRVRIQVGDEHDYKRVSTFPFNTILGLNTNYSESFGETVSVGNDVWIGESVRILSGSNIGDGVVVGAGSVIKGNLIPYGIYVGNPAKLIKMRFSDDIISFLLQLKWWDWSDEKILNNSHFFSQDLSQTTTEQIISYIN